MPSLLSALLTLLLLTPAAARAQSLAICHVGGPGSTSQAKPVLEQFLRHVEQSGGLAKGSMSGEYHTTLAGCLKYVKQAKPLFAVLDLATYLAQSKTLKLKPLACMGSPTGQRYHLLVREGSYKKPAELAGKTVYVPMDDKAFISNIALGGTLDAAKLKLKVSRRPLKGIRKVARGKADATLVDAMTYEHLGELKLPVKLVSIHDSPGLPGLTLAVLGTAKANPRVVKKVTGALPRLCSGEGKKMCKTVRVTSFTRVKAGLYRKLERRYR